MSHEEEDVLPAEAAVASSERSDAPSVAGAHSGETIAAALARHKVLVNNITLDVETSSKKAVGFIDKHMRRGADSNATPPEQRIDDFKRAAAEFNSSSKSTIKRLKELALGLDATLLEHSTSQQQQQAAAAPPTALPAAATSSAAESSLELESAKSKVLELEGTVATLKTQIEASNAQLQQERADFSRQSAAAASALAAKSNDVDTLTAELEQLRRQFTQVDNAFRSAQQTFFNERDAMQQCVQQVKSELRDKDSEIERHIADVTRRQDAINSMLKDQEDEVLQRKILEERLAFAEKKRECDFLAFEHAVRDHEKELCEWQRKYADVTSQVSRLRQDKENLQSRVVDEQLREHIRVLQRENNVLREEKVKLLHSEARDPMALKILTSTLQETVAALEREKGFIADQNADLVKQLDAKDKELYDMELRFADQRAELRREADELDRRLRFFESKAAEANLAVFRDPEADVDQEMQNAMAEHLPVEQATVAVETWERSVQVDDTGRVVLEREVIRLATQVEELTEDLERLRDKDQKSRSDLQEKLLAQMRSFEAQVEALEKETKVRAFKLSKAQQQTEQLEGTVLDLQKQLSDARNAEGQWDYKLHEAEKANLNLGLENEELRTKIKVLRKEIEELHQQAAEETAARAVNFESGRQQQLHVRSASSGVTAENHLSSTASQSAAPPAMNNSNNAAAKSSRLEAVRKLDDLLLDLHHQSIHIDNDEHQTTSDADVKRAKRQERMAYIEAARPFWEKAARQPVQQQQQQRGPNGESPLNMIRGLDAEIETLRNEELAAEAALQKFYSSVAKKRDQLHQATTKIIEKRNQLLDSLRK